ncbi:unnamed protein product [Amoebophrya sp. A25]|nr:unnamed protein product [Amoebophrya sp. A25]|eukprot:GSA25T00009317001.1
MMGLGQDETRRGPFWLLRLRQGFDFTSAGFDGASDRDGSGCKLLPSPDERYNQGGPHQRAGSTSSKTANASKKSTSSLGRKALESLGLKKPKEQNEFDVQGQNEFDVQEAPSTLSTPLSSYCSNGGNSTTTSSSKHSFSAQLRQQTTAIASTSASTTTPSTTTKSSIVIPLMTWSRTHEVRIPEVWLGGLRKSIPWLPFSSSSSSSGSAAASLPARQQYQVTAYYSILLDHEARTCDVHFSTESPAKSLLNVDLCLSFLRFLALCEARSTSKKNVTERGEIVEEIAGCRAQNNVDDTVVKGDGKQLFSYSRDPLAFDDDNDTIAPSSAPPTASDASPYDDDDLLAVTTSASPPGAKIVVSSLEFNPAARRSSSYGVGSFDSSEVLMKPQVINFDEPPHLQGNREHNLNFQQPRLAQEMDFHACPHLSSAYDTSAATPNSVIGVASSSGTSTTSVTTQPQLLVFPKAAQEQPGDERGRLRLDRVRERGEKLVQLPGDGIDAETNGTSKNLPEDLDFQRMFEALLTCSSSCSTTGDGLQRTSSSFLTPILESHFQKEEEGNNGTTSTPSVGLVLAAILFGYPELAKYTLDTYLLQKIDSLPVLMIAQTAFLGCVLQRADLRLQSYWLLQHAFANGAPGLECTQKGAPVPVACNAVGEGKDGKNGATTTVLYDGESLRFSGLKIEVSRLWADFQKLERHDKEFATAVVPGYALCKIHVIRDGKEIYPQIYELRRDHDSALLLQAIKENDNDPVRIYKCNSHPDLLGHKLGADVVLGGSSEDDAQGADEPPHSTTTKSFEVGGTATDDDLAKWARNNLPQKLSKLVQRQPPDLFSGPAHDPFPLDPETTSETGLGQADVDTTANFASSMRNEMEGWTLRDFARNYVGSVEPSFWGTNFLIKDHVFSSTSSLGTTTTTAEKGRPTTSSGGTTGATSSCCCSTTTSSRPAARAELQYEMNLAGRVPRKITCKFQEEVLQVEEVVDVEPELQLHQHYQAVVSNQSAASTDALSDPLGSFNASTSAQTARSVVAPPSSSSTTPSNYPHDQQGQKKVVYKTRTFENVAPRWNSKQKSYVLPFFGRVKTSSAKNFQLVDPAEPDEVLLLFGKIKTELFALDYRHPLSMLDAFGIAISSLAKKRAVS